MKIWILLSIMPVYCITMIEGGGGGGIFLFVISTSHVFHVLFVINRNVEEQNKYETKLLTKRYIKARHCLNQQVKCIV